MLGAVCLFTFFSDSPALKKIFPKVSYLSGTQRIEDGLNEELGPSAVTNEVTPAQRNLLIIATSWNFRGNSDSILAMEVENDFGADRGRELAQESTRPDDDPCSAFVQRDING